MAGNPFTRHPKEVGETYFEHMGIASGVGLQMAIGALACFVHAVFPFLCVRTGSQTSRSASWRCAQPASRASSLAGVSP